MLRSYGTYVILSFSTRLSRISQDQEFSRSLDLCQKMTNHILQLLVKFQWNLMECFKLKKTRTLQKDNKPYSLTLKKIIKIWCSILRIWQEMLIFGIYEMGSKIWLNCPLFGKQGNFRTKKGPKLSKQDFLGKFLCQLPCISKPLATLCKKQHCEKSYVAI